MWKGNVSWLKGFIWNIMNTLEVRIPAMPFFPLQKPVLPWLYQPYR